MPYADLEIRILERQNGVYPVEITLEGTREFPRGHLDSTQLPWTPGADTVADGLRLFQWLFADDALKTAWAEARGQHVQRRLRLRIDTDAPELHAIPWELLREPRDDGPPAALATSSATPFSRYLAGTWRPGSPILRRPIKVLVVIANPAGLKDKYGLAPVDVELEWSQLQAATQGLEVALTLLSDPCTPARMEAELHQGYHVLHVVSHGAYDPTTQRSVLYLADDQNYVQLVHDQDLAVMLANLLAAEEQKLDNRLRLVFLAACQSATRSPADALRGLAPQLIHAGVPAVLAMQDLVAVETARQFASTFYRQLLQDGQVDLAANVARAAVTTEGRPDMAVPTLFMRLRNGQLLGNRGQILGDRAGSFWNTLLENIADGWCTPFLGPGVTAHLLPGPVELAQQLAAEYHYPFQATESLPRVAQFVGTMDNRRLRQQIIQGLIKGFRSRLGLPSDPADRRQPLTAVIESSNWIGHSQVLFESEIHQQLADLDLPIFITTNFDNFMTLALQAKGYPVRRELVPWRASSALDTGRPHFDLDPPPSSESPVVLHLYGSDDDPLSMVLTEDDYLDYLARISRDYEYLLPTSVQDALASTTLLFLGYRLQDLDLKVIMRGLLTNLDLERWGMLHVAVQIQTESVDQGQIDEVTRFFQKYFANSKIDVYWGSAQQFVADLHARWQEYSHG